MVERVSWMPRLVRLACVLGVLIGNPAVGATLRVAASGTERHAELRTLGRIEGLTVGPDGSLWVCTAVGNVYHAPAFGAPWTYGPLISYRDWESSAFSNHPHLDRITFFDAKRALMTGFISQGTKGEYTGRYDGVYRTEDGGQSCRLESFGGDSWIDSTWFQPDGRGWMGGSSGVLHATTDFGASWKEISQPFDHSKRAYRIRMLDDRHGYVGACANALRVTSDGGRSWTDLPTPKDQRSTPPDREGNGCDHRITRLIVVHGQLVVEQCGRAFRSAREPVGWEPLGIAVRLLDADPKSDRLVGIGGGGRLVAFDRQLRGTRLEHPPLAEIQDLKVRGDSVYMLDERGSVWRFRYGALEVHPQLTIDHPIDTPSIVRRRAGRFWGASAKHLYTAEDERLDWRRVASPSFNIRGIVVLDDARVFLFSGQRENASFDRTTGQLAPVPALEDHDVVGVLEGPGLLLAYGGKQHETMRRIVGARTFFSGQFRGSRNEGFVAASWDAGRSWTVVDRWENGIQYAQRLPDGAVVLLSPIGTVRWLIPDARGTGFTARTAAVETATNRTSLPFVQWSPRFYFESRDVGFLAGSYCHAPSTCFQTSDGGRTWVRRPVETLPYDAVRDARGGAVGQRGFELWWLDGAFRRKLVDLSAAMPKEARIADVSVDDTGALVVRLSRDGLLLARPQASGACAVSQLAADAPVRR